MAAGPGHMTVDILGQVALHRGQFWSFEKSGLRTTMSHRSRSGWISLKQHPIVSNRYR